MTTSKSLLLSSYSYYYRGGLVSKKKDMEKGRLPFTLERSKGVVSLLDRSTQR